VTLDVEGLVAFLRAAFHAGGELVWGRPSLLKIGGSVIMVSDGSSIRPAMPAFLHLHVLDADQTSARAIAAGAHAIEEPAIMP
jgi:PhnB protein